MIKFNSFLRSLGVTAARAVADCLRDPETKAEPLVKAFTDRLEALPALAAEAMSSAPVTEEAKAFLVEYAAETLPDVLARLRAMLDGTVTAADADDLILRVEDLMSRELRYVFKNLQLRQAGDREVAVLAVSTECCPTCRALARQADARGAVDPSALVEHFGVDDCPSYLKVLPVFDGSTVTVAVARGWVKTPQALAHRVRNVAAKAVSLCSAVMPLRPRVVLSDEGLGADDVSTVADGAVTLRPRVVTLERDLLYALLGGPGLAKLARKVAEAEGLTPFEALATTKRLVVDAVTLGRNRATDSALEHAVREFLECEPAPQRGGVEDLEYGGESGVADGPAEAPVNRAYVFRRGLDDRPVAALYLGKNEVVAYLPGLDEEERYAVNVLVGLPSLRYECLGGRVNDRRAVAVTPADGDAYVEAVNQATGAEFKREKIDEDGWDDPAAVLRGVCNGENSKPKGDSVDATSGV